MNYFCNQKNKIEIKKTKQNSFVIIFLKETEKCGEGTIKIGKLILITPFRKKKKVTLKSGNVYEPGGKKETRCNLAT